MTGSFTPGPWAIETPIDPDSYEIVQAGLEAYEWQFIATVQVGTPADGLFPRQEAKRNARLIAAAPEIYEALKAAMVLLREYDFPGAHPHRKVVHDQARDALAKASGEDSRTSGNRQEGRA